MPNYMDPSKRIQYSAFNKIPKANIVLYDENNQPIIRKEELDKGLYNMINKGLIPKGADLSPAFENNGGNPMQINMRFREDFTKKAERDEIVLDKTKGSMKIDLSKRGNSNDSDGFFITKPQEVININSPPIIHDIEDNKIPQESNIEDNNTSANQIIDQQQNKKKRILIISNKGVKYGD